MTFDRIKRIFWNLWFDYAGVKHGKLFSYSPPIFIELYNGGKLQLGDNVTLSHNVTISPSEGGEIIIGNNVRIGMNSVLRASNLNYRTFKECVPGKITLGDNVWIGANSVIVPNVHIGSGSVIGAGSVVTKDIPENVLAVGNPCRVVKKIERDEEIHYSDK
jgi:galactoside O-acetyltransferase